MLAEQLADIFNRGEYAHPLSLDQLGVSHADADQRPAFVKEPAARPAMFRDPGGDEKRSIRSAVIELEPEDLDELGIPA